METEDAAAGICSSRPTCSSQFAGQFKFTPIATSKRKTPRLWERKPSTPFLARSKPRKLWKRFRTSFSSMKTLQERIGNGDEDDELLTEINASATAGLLRGVKRQCLDVRGAEIALDTGAERGRSFLETKWELESRRKRKYATRPDCHHHTTQQNTAIDREQNPSTESVSGRDLYENESTPGVETEDALPPHDDQPETISNRESSDVEAFPDGQVPDKVPTTPTEHVMEHDPRHGTESTHQLDHPSKTKTLGDSEDGAVALSFHSDYSLPVTQSLEEADETVNRGDSNPVEDASMDDPSSPELDAPSPAIREMVEEESKTAAAEGKRLMVEEASLIRSALRTAALDGDDAELLNDFLSRAKAKRAANAAMTPKDAVKPVPADLLPESPTPRSRRALEELDKNSPSLAPSPTKADSSPDAVDEGQPDAVPPEDPQPTSPACRRSTRTRLPKAPQRAPPPAVPNQIPVRRANGTEFVFLQRTEAQELALTTRRNTKRNKGDAQMPKHVLEALAQRPEEVETTSTSTSHRRRAGGKDRKQVSWNERLVEYEDEGGAGSSSDDVVDAAGAQAAPRRHVGARRPQAPAPAQVQAQGDRSTGVSTTAPATPRVRRLGLAGALSPANKHKHQVSSTTTNATTMNSSTSTPISKRKQLAPKSPSAALLGTTKTAIGRPRLGAGTSGSSTSKTAVKSKSILQAGAGATPMPKRVRARR